MTIANTTYIPKSSTYTIPTITSPTILNTPILTNAVTTNKISLLTNTNTLLPSVTNSTIQTVITATDPISSQTKTLLCEKLTELKQSNNISLQAVTYILSQYNISLTEAASLLNVPLLQLSTMSVAQIEGLVSSTCQEYGTAALSSGSASQSSNTTYIPNNQSYNSSRSTYNNTSGYSGHRGGQNRGSFSNDDRYDRENDYSDYWYDGTEYKYNHRVWRWVLLGVFCALCIAVAFALLCFACYRPYHSPTPTVVTPLPVTEKIYTTNGQIEVPPLPISPMPAYSNAATLRI